MVATFAVELDDGVSGAAGTAADALDSLEDKIAADVKALSEMQSAMRRLKGGTSTSVAAFRELRDKIAATKASIADAQARYVELGGQFGKAKPKQDGAASGFDAIVGSASRVPGPIGQVAGKLGTIRGLLSSGLAVGIAAVAAALLAVAAASVAAAASLARYGIAAANARREELLRLEGLTKLRTWYGAAAGNAGELQQSIDRVSSSSALGRGKIEEYAGQLYRMGLRGRNLDVTLGAMAMRGAVLGDQYAHSFAGMAAGAVRTGQSVDRLAERVRARLGGVASRQMLSMSVQSEKLSENLAMLFSGLRMDGFLGGLQRIGAMFSQSTATGRALKGMIERMFQPLLDGAGGAAPLMKRFFQGMIIAALGLEIRIQRLRLWLRRTFGDSEMLAGIDGMRVAVAAGAGAFAMLAAAVGLSAIAVGAVVYPFVQIGIQVARLITWFEEARDMWSSESWRTIGSQIVDGIAYGIERAKSKAINALRGLGRTLQSVFRIDLGIHSPSRVFAGLGVQIPRGVEAGIRRGSDGVEAAVSSMVPVPSFGGGAVASAAGAAVRSGRPMSSGSVSIGEIHVHTQATDARGVAADLRAELARILEGLALEVGAA